MNPINIKYYKSVTGLTKWNHLLSGTYFMSLQWHKVVLSFYQQTFITKKINTLSYFEASFEPNTFISGFFYVSKSIKEKTITFGHLLGPSDYYDLMYSPTVTDEQFQTLMNTIKFDFKASEMKFVHLKETSKFYQAIAKMDTLQVNPLTCVELTLPETYAVYFQQLSKSVRQNIRTAYNRASKNNVNYQLQVFSKAESACINWKHLKEMYQQRNQFRKQKKYWKSAIYYQLDYLFNKEKDLFDYEATKLTDFTLAILKMNEEIAAYFFGFQMNNSLEINRVVINDVFKFYSPGLVLFNEFIQQNIHHLDVIDLTVGDEKYKFDLGGEKHFIYSGNIRMNVAFN